MKTKLFISVITLILLSSLTFAGEKIKETSFKVFGNCSSCQERIEGSLHIKEVKSASWNKDTKMLTVQYAADKISLDSLQQRIAAVGHDTEKYKASDDTYNALPGCCLYRK